MQPLLVMRTTSFGILLCGAVVSGFLACGAQPADDGGGVSTEKGSGGKSGSKGGSSGSSSTGGSAGSAPAPAGGSPGSTATGGSSGSTATGGSTTPGTGGATETGGASGGGVSGSDASAPPADDAAAPPPGPPAAGAPYGCTGCTRLFNGMNLDGWETVEGAWAVKPGGILASTGKPNDIYTKEDFGDYRIFFQIRQIMGSHKPCTVLFGTRPAAGQAPKRGLGGAQFQPPNGSSWNYGIGGKFTGHPHPAFDVKQWHQCEVLVREAGTFRAACCPLMGDAPCKTVDVLSWMGPSKKAPFDIMMHNPGLFDEYREIWIEKGPAAGDTLLSQK